MKLAAPFPGSYPRSFGGVVDAKLLDLFEFPRHDLNRRADRDLLDRLPYPSEEPPAFLSMRSVT